MKKTQNNNNNNNNGNVLLIENKLSKSIIRIIDPNLGLHLSNIANEKDERLGLV